MSYLHKIYYCFISLSLQSYNWKIRLKHGTNFQFFPNLMQRENMDFKNKWRGDLQDGRGVRHRDHLPPHKYIRYTATCGTTPTEHLLNTGRRPQTSQKARNSPCTWVGQMKKKKKQRQKNRDGTCTSGRELWSRKSFHTLGSPFTGGDMECMGESFRATEESTATGVQGAKQRDSHTENPCRPALTSLRGFSAHPPGWVGTGSWGSGFGSQTPRRGLELAAWRQPDRVSAPQLAWRDSRKKPGPA